MSARLIILDIGSTLVEGPSRGPASRIAARLNLKAGEKRALFAALMTRPFTTPQAVGDFVGENFGQTGSDARGAIESVWSAQEKEARPIKGAIDALDRLRNHGLRIALVSNIWYPYLLSVRRHFGSFFDDNIPPELQLFSFREGYAKPSLELFRRALDRARVPAHQALMVGDSYPEDVEPAATLGIKTLWILHRPGKEALNVVRVLNREAVPPSHALRSISGLNLEVILSACNHSQMVAGKIPGALRANES